MRLLERRQTECRLSVYGGFVPSELIFRGQSLARMAPLIYTVDCYMLHRNMGMRGSFILEEVSCMPVAELCCDKYGRWYVA